MILKIDDSTLMDGNIHANRASRAQPSSSIMLELNDNQY